ncbi:hypothetical protein ACHAXS_000626 [Conticribra weissflogii]
MFVGSDHTEDKQTSCPHSGFLIYHQATIETGVFCTDFVAMKNGVDMLQGLKYKPRIMGVTINSATHIYGDNMSVIKNSSKPESILNKS